MSTPASSGWGCIALGLFVRPPDSGYRARQGEFRGSHHTYGEYDLPRGRLTPLKTAHGSAGETTSPTIALTASSPARRTPCAARSRSTVPRPASSSRPCP